jgi:hypothetical protein
MFEGHPGAKELFYCPACDVTFLFQGSERPGFKDDDEEVRCLDCRAVLGHIRADCGPPGILKRRSGKHDWTTFHE